MPNDADDVTIKLDAYVKVIVTCCLISVWCDRSMSVLLGLTNGEGTCAISSTKLTLFADFPRILLRVIILHISSLISSSRRTSIMSREFALSSNEWLEPSTIQQAVVRWV